LEPAGHQTKLIVFGFKFDCASSKLSSDIKGCIIGNNSAEAIASFGRLFYILIRLKPFKFFYPQITQNSQKKHQNGEKLKTKNYELRTKNLKLFRMMMLMFEIVGVIASYLVGAIPFGLIFTRFFSNIDVRTVGSGNIGATNVLRAAGKKAAILTLLADALKGFLPVFVVQHLFHTETAAALSGAAAIVGHNFSVYLKFKGGKGVATSFGVVLAVSPWIGLVSLLAWLAAAVIWRYSSLSALIAFACYPLLTFAAAKEVPQPYKVLSLFVFAMIYYRHRENIKRLLAGTEPKIGKK
jgi:glycerol-3-phosphate acyltransferase PlsY